MIRSTIIATMLLLGSTFPSQAAFFTGSDLADHCKAGDQDLFCVGYIAGVVDWWLAEAAHPEYTCIPDGAKLKQLGAVVAKYLQDNPEKWNDPASFLVMASLTKAFPCP